MIARVWQVLWSSVRRWWTAFLARSSRRGDPVERRLNRLRAIYGADNRAGLHTRRVRDTLRDAVAPQYYDYYDRLLRLECSIADMLRKDVLPGIATADLYEHVRTLTERSVRLLDQIQRSDRLLTLYAADSAEYLRVTEARQRLADRLDESMTLQESIPVTVLQLASTAASSGRNFTRLRDTLDELKARLQDVTESYTELNNGTSNPPGLFQEIDLPADPHSQEKRKENRLRT